MSASTGSSPSSPGAPRGSASPYPWTWPVAAPGCSSPTAATSIGPAAGRPPWAWSRDGFEPLLVDLSDLASIDRLVEDLARRGVRLDRLVLNAAIVPLDARSTPQGLDEMFVVNYLSSFVLVTRLLEEGVLPRDRPEGGVPRVIFVASEAHRWSEDLVLDGLDRPRDGSARRVLDWYGTYKLMLATFAWELARRLSVDGVPRVAVFALCPGAMRTNIARELPAPLRAPLGVVMRLFFQDPFVADEPVLHLACSRALEGRTALYLHRMARKEIDARAADPESGRALWAHSEAVLARVGAGARKGNGPGGIPPGPSSSVAPPEGGAV